MHGNFSEFSNDRIFTGTVSKTIESATRKDCALACVVYPTCLFANHKLDDTKCELLDSNEGIIQAKTGWEFISTSYMDTQNVGIKNLVTVFYRV